MIERWMPGQRMGHFRDFQRSESFRVVHGMASDFFSQPHSSEDVARFLTGFAGKVYEEMALAAITKRTPANALLFPQEDTARFFHDLYRSKPIFYNDFDTTIRGVSVPDFLLFEEQEGSKEPVLTKVFEATLGKDLERLRRKVEVFEMRRKRRSDVFENVSLMFVIPKSGLGFRSRIARLAPFVEIRQMPFTREEFREFMDFLEAGLVPNGDTQGPLPGKARKSSR